MERIGSDSKMCQESETVRSETQKLMRNDTMMMTAKSLSKVLATLGYLKTGCDTWKSPSLSNSRIGRITCEEKKTRQICKHLLNSIVNSSWIGDTDVTDSVCMLSHFRVAAISCFSFQQIDMSLYNATDIFENFDYNGYWSVRATKDAVRKSVQYEKDRDKYWLRAYFWRKLYKKTKSDYRSHDVDLFSDVPC